MSEATLLTLAIAVPIGALSILAGLWFGGGWEAVRRQWWAVPAVIVVGVVIALLPSQAVVASALSALLAAAIWRLAPETMPGIRRLAWIIAIVMATTTAVLVVLASTGRGVTP